MSTDVLMALMDQELLAQLDEGQRDVVARRLVEELERDPELRERLRSVLVSAARDLISPSPASLGIGPQ